MRAAGWSVYTGHEERQRLGPALPAAGRRHPAVPATAPGEVTRPPPAPFPCTLQPPPLELRDSLTRFAAQGRVSAESAPSQRRPCAHREAQAAGAGGSSAPDRIAPAAGLPPRLQLTRSALRPAGPPRGGVRLTCLSFLRRLVRAERQTRSRICDPCFLPPRGFAQRCKTRGKLESPRGAQGAAARS